MDFFLFFSFSISCPVEYTKNYCFSLSFTPFARVYMYRCDYAKQGGGRDCYPYEVYLGTHRSERENWNRKMTYFRFPFLLFSFFLFFFLAHFLFFLLSLGYSSSHPVLY